ncbi:glycosyltransferase family 4 protein [Mucilaginibacter sp. FT3.2]|uniref:glycosyltransferase family 4 protein n=1 Tax=Mucilaginibacter sp. FT3.2 TaxID=2723090 RepID=UPI001618CE20|nr:glycosyltransferase family 4 protein [Mucilaginibacter sp. FT3.2]MBB6233566.1 glycosyltransferase involved in cell wall biosynthesis [Mucilaginibacter sp. FT3.2]
MKLIKLVDLTYHSHLKYTRPGQVMENHAPALAFAPYLKDRLDFMFVKHASFEQHTFIDDIPYHFFRGGNKFWSLSLKTHRFIKKVKPDIILVQGLVFPIQVMFLRLFCGKKIKLIIQHHGELPSTGVKGRLQKIACNMADAFFFTSAGNTTIWKKKNILGHDAHVMEVLEASTSFKPIDKHTSKIYTGITGDTNFIWVGHFNANKDPLTVIAGFEQYIKVKPSARLYMIYQTESLLDLVKKKLALNPALFNAVVLVGKIANEDMPYWFSAADFYLSGSHKEGSGYALLEAMACGCIPIVTAIPSYQKITCGGEYGFLYPVADAHSLANTLISLEKVNRKKLAEEVLAHFSQNLSFKTIADDMVKICSQLMAK